MTQIYLNDECLSIARRMPHGELSKICQNAVKEWIGFTDSIEFFSQKIETLKKEISEKNSQLEFLVEKLKEKELELLNNKNNVEKTKEQLEEERTKRTFDKKIERLMDWTFVENTCELPREEIYEYAKTFTVDNELKKKFGLDFSEYLKTFGIFQIENIIIKKAQ